MGDPYTQPPKRKGKWTAGLLSFVFPGLGHMYAGAMRRGLFFMLLLLGFILGVVLVSIKGIVPLIVLLAVMIPAVYFYGFFDALKTTDRLNEARDCMVRNEGASCPGEGYQGRSESWSIGGGQGGLVLVGIGALIFLAVDQPVWMDRVLDGFGSLFGAIGFITVGVMIYLSGSGKNR
jgi:TM2 domain-containing membrane protein YozV